TTGVARNERNIQLLWTKHNFKWTTREDDRMLILDPQYFSIAHNVCRCDDPTRIVRREKACAPTLVSLYSANDKVTCSRTGTCICVVRPEYQIKCRTVVNCAFARQSQLKRVALKGGTYETVLLQQAERFTDLDRLPTGKCSVKLVQSHQSIKSTQVHC